MSVWKRIFREQALRFTSFDYPFLVTEMPALLIAELPGIFPSLWILMHKSNYTTAKGAYQSRRVFLSSNNPVVADIMLNALVML